MQMSWHQQGQTFATAFNLFVLVVLYEHNFAAQTETV
jgi:hypothetical protein